MYQLRTLGTLDLRATDGHSIQSLLAQPRRCAVLSYLAVALPHGFHRRERIAALFWPESDTERARHSLRQALHAIRSALGESVLETHGDHEVALSSAQVWCDAAELDRAFEEKRWADVVELHRGPLLDGFSVYDCAEFEHWLDEQRERLRARAETAAWKCVEEAVARQDHGGALVWGRRALELAPTDESALRRFMQLAASFGDRRSAAQGYETFVTRLRREYELEPSAETETLMYELRKATTSPAASVAAPAPVAPSVPEGAPATRISSPLRLRPWLLVAAATLVVVSSAWFMVMPERESIAPAEAEAAPPSLLVTPFQQMTRGPVAEDLALGLTAQLITDLARSGLPVVGQQSALTLRGRAGDIRETAARFGVGMLLEGDVFVWGDRVRVNARLVDGSSGIAVWTTTYDAKDFGVILDEFARAVVRELNDRLGFQAAVPGTPTLIDPRAYEPYLRGRAGIARLTPATLERAAAEFRAAIGFDHRFAEAWSGLAFALGYTRGGVFVRDDPRTDIRDAARKALELDPSLAEAYVALAFTARTIEDRRSYLDSALIRNPNDLWAVYFSAMLYDGVGQPERAIRQMSRLLVIEPLSPKSYYMNANLLNGVGQHARADSLASIGLAIDSLSLGEKLLWPGYWNRAWALLMLGNYELAGAMLQHKALVVRDSNATGLDTVIAGIAAVQRKTPGWPARRAAALSVLAAHQRDWEAGVGDAYWKRPCGMFTFDCHWVPVYHALLEDVDGMFVSLEKWPVDALGLCTPIFLRYQADRRLQRLQRESGIRCPPQALDSARAR